MSKFVSYWEKTKFYRAVQSLSEERWRNKFSRDVVTNYRLNDDTRFRYSPSGHVSCGGGSKRSKIRTRLPKTKTIWRFWTQTKKWDVERLPASGGIHEFSARKWLAKKGVGSSAVFARGGCGAFCKDAPAADCSKTFSNLDVLVSVWAVKSSNFLVLKFRRRYNSPRMLVAFACRLGTVRQTRVNELV